MTESQYNSNPHFPLAVQSGNMPLTLDMTDWSILDFELAFDGLHMLDDAAMGLTNQPRASTADGRDYRKGAGFIADFKEQWIAPCLSALMERLQAIRFEDPEDDDRRLRLLVIYHAEWGPAGESLPNILAMVTGQAAAA